MMKITNSEHCVVDESSDLYLSWNDMKWNKFGNISEYNETKGNMCQIRYNITTIFLTGMSFSVTKAILESNIFVNWSVCCQNPSAYFF